jgi:hypothetical protein
MAVSFLTAAQRDRYGRYPDVVTPNAGPAPNSWVRCSTALSLGCLPTRFYCRASPRSSASSSACAPGSKPVYINC